MGFDQAFIIIDFHLWAFILHHGFSSSGFWDFHHHKFSSMGISVISPLWIFIHELFRFITIIDFHLWAFVLVISPPWISILGLSDFTTIDFHLWALISYHHHGFSSLGFQIFTIIDFHLWASISVISPPWIFILRLSDFHHHRFSSMSIYFSYFTTMDFHP